MRLTSVISQHTTCSEKSRKRFPSLTQLRALLTLSRAAHTLHRECRERHAPAGDRGFDEGRKPERKPMSALKTQPCVADVDGTETFHVDPSGLFLGGFARVISFALPETHRVRPQRSSFGLKFQCCVHTAVVVFQDPSWCCLCVRAVQVRQVLLRVLALLPRPTILCCAYPGGLILLFFISVVPHERLKKSCQVEPS